MPSDHGYTVDLGEVYDYLGEKTVKVTDLSGIVCGGVRSMGGATTGLPPIAKPAELALREALDLLGLAVGTVTELFRDTSDGIGAAMKGYADTDAAGAANLRGISAALSAPPGTDPFRYLDSHANQVQEGMAEIGIWPRFDPSLVRLAPGDLCTTSAGRLLVVGRDLRFYEHDRPVATPTGQEVRVYRRMSPGGEPA